MHPIWLPTLLASYMVVKQVFEYKMRVIFTFKHGLNRRIHLSPSEVSKYAEFRLQALLTCIATFKNV